MFRDRAGKTPPGRWLLFTSFDNLLQGGDLMMPDLDAISKVHPILVYYINMHTAAGNSAAFAAAQIPDDIGPLPGGGRFGRDASGKLNGMIYEESALKKFAIAIPKITPELAGKAVVDWLKVNASFGNTSVHEAGVLVFGNLLEGYERVAAQVALPRQHQPDVQIHEGCGALQKIRLRRGGDTDPEYHDDDLRHEDRRRRIQPDQERRADRSLSERYREGPSQFRRRADDVDGRRRQSPRMAGVDPLQRRRDPGHRARRDRGRLRPLPRQASTGSSTAQLRASSRSSGWRASASSRAS